MGLLGGRLFPVSDLLEEEPPEVTVRHLLVLAAKTLILVAEVGQLEPRPTGSVDPVRKIHRAA